MGERVEERRGKLRAMMERLDAEVAARDDAD
jgi:hypothetical protein